MTGEGVLFNGSCTSSLDFESCQRGTFEAKVEKKRLTKCSEGYHDDYPAAIESTISIPMGEMVAKGEHRDERGDSSQTVN